MVMIVAGIPAFNEDATIAKVLVHASSHVDKVLVVDDGSTDDTSLIAEKLGATVIKHERNLGKGTAMRSIFEWVQDADADVLVTLDADGQHDSSEIPNLVRPILEGQADVVVGCRKASKNIPLYRRVGGRFLDHLTGISVGGVVVDAQSGFRAYSRKAFERVNVGESGMGVDSEIMMIIKEAGLRIIEVPISVNYDVPNRSTHNAPFHALDVFFSVIKFMSIRHPFLFYGTFSAIMFVVAAAFGIQTLEYYGKYGQVVTNLALVSVSAGILAFLSFFTGILLFTLITVIRENR